MLSWVVIDVDIELKVSELLSVVLNNASVIS